MMCDRINKIVKQKIEQYEIAVEMAVFEGKYTHYTADHVNISLYEEYDEPIEYKKFYSHRRQIGD